MITIKIIKAFSINVKFISEKIISINSEIIEKYTYMYKYSSIH